MKILLTGVSCVGKSTIGAALAQDIGFRFFDLDREVEFHYGKSISQLQAQFRKSYTYRKKAYCPVLTKILFDPCNREIVLALPPSGLRDCMYTSIKQIETTTIALFDEPQNILSRIVFFDFDSKKIDKKLTEPEKMSYLEEISSDLSFFKKFYKRADFQLSIADLSISECVQAIKNLLIMRQLGPTADHQQLKTGSKTQKLTID